MALQSTYKLQSLLQRTKTRECFPINLAAKAMEWYIPFTCTCQKLFQPSEIWVVAGEQYCSVAEILLALSKPNTDILQFRILGIEQSQGIIQGHALKVCGLAFTNENIAARVNAFGPLAFCKSAPVEVDGPEH